MKIIGIDPSFSSTGISFVDNSELKDFEGIHQGGQVYSGIDKVNESACIISSKIFNFVDKNNPDAVIIEYPAQSKSGFYLMLLHGWIVSRLHKLNIKLYAVPPTACDSFIKNSTHSKSFIVNHCKESGWVPSNIRINNDICTSVVLTHLLEAFLANKYRNKVFQIK